MHLLKRTPIERIIRRLERHPTVVVTAATLSLRFAKDYQRVRSGEIDGAEFKRRGWTHVGSISGGMAGAAAGAVAGTAFVPGLGTILGAFTGSVVGDEAGSRIGRAAVEHAEVQWSRARTGPPQPSAPPEEAEPAQTPRRKL